MFGHSPGKETFIVEIIPNGATNNDIPVNYYRIDNTHMAPIPYGYALDPTDNTKTKIVAVTGAARFGEAITNIPVGGMIPDGFYKVSDVSMARIPMNPPGLMPNITGITYNNGTFSKTYGFGYITKEEYLNLEFPIPSGSTTLPPNMYYSNSAKTKLKFLPYGKKADTNRGYDMTDNENIMLTEASMNVFSSYRDISSNVNISYHPSIEDINQQLGNDSTDQDTVVVDKDGNRYVLPKMNMQNTTLFYEPGSYTYSAANYVPSYEDSVFLSKTTWEPTTAKYESQTAKGGICEANKESKIELETACQKLDSNTCSSTTCCVLLGGQKCVAGNQNGPTMRSNYSDMGISNTDYYYYQGKCYGNCSAE